MLTMLRNTHMRTKQFASLQCLFSAKCNFCEINIMYICVTRYVCNAIQQIVMETSCGFSLFSRFQITSVSVLDFKLFSQNICNKMISRKKNSTFKNLEVASCYSKDFNREFRSNLNYVKTNLFRANFKKLFECS